MARVKMKNTRILSASFAAVCFACMLSGCTGSSYQVPYSDMAKQQSFAINTGSLPIEAAPLFAHELCVAPGDVGISPSINLPKEDQAIGLFDLSNRIVIYGDNLFDRFYPASITKVMTALLALEHGNLDDELVVSAAASGIKEPGATLADLKTGDTMTLDQALNALLLKSANDAAIAIAEHIAGSEEAFVDMMNAEARALGATGTHFTNPHGLSNEDHYTTAYDLYLIFNKAIQYERFNQIISMDKYTSVYHDRNGNERKFDFSTSNLYLKGTKESPGTVSIIGGKTGTTNAAGNCLILLSRDRSGNPYISIDLHSSTRDSLYEEMNILLDRVGK